ncbi:MAG: hypothetical protein K9G70_13470, partial [Prolixibacteraceae bacterium]|nr:hypothetical protein [Prolixibacteraceae bacterium]
FSGITNINKLSFFRLRGLLSFFRSPTASLQKERSPRKDKQPYETIQVGMKRTSHKSERYENLNYKTTDPVFAVFGGARYYFTEQLAAYIELNRGVQFFSFGLSYKLINQANN